MKNPWTTNGKHNKTMEKRWKPTRNHYKPMETNEQNYNMKGNEKCQTNENWKTDENQWETMKTDEKPWTTNQWIWFPGITNPMWGVSTLLSGEEPIIRVWAPYNPGRYARDMRGICAARTLGPLLVLDQWETMKNSWITNDKQRTTNEKPMKTFEKLWNNNENKWKTMKNPWKTNEQPMKNNEKPKKTNEKQWSTNEN